MAQGRQNRSATRTEPGRGSGTSRAGTQIQPHAVAAQYPLTFTVLEFGGGSGGATFLLGSGRAG